MMIDYVCCVSDRKSVLKCKDNGGAGAGQVRVPLRFASNSLVKARGQSSRTGKGGHTRAEAA